MKLYYFQEKAVSILADRLNQYDGVLLRADEGTGKTIMAATIATQQSGKVLWVLPANSKKGVDAKLKEYGMDKQIDTVSYHRFKVAAQLPLNPYSFFVFDECHNLRNWSAGWTQRFMRLKNRKMLFLTATPAIKSAKDYVYCMRKAGVLSHFKSTEDVYRYFFSAKKSRFGDFLEFGEFVNRDEFATLLDKFSYDIKMYEVDKAIPPTKYNFITLDGHYQVPANIQEETEVRKNMGLSKVDQVVEIVKNSGIKTGLVLCHFHDVASKSLRGWGSSPPSLAPRSTKTSIG